MYGWVLLGWVLGLLGFNLQSDGCKSPKWGIRLSQQVPDPLYVPFAPQVAMGPPAGPLLTEALIFQPERFHVGQGTLKPT